MIGKLRGVVDSYGEDHIILDVQGVGYLVHCSGRTLQALPGIGEAATLFIETFVREDMIRLYGFVSQAEKSWFMLLLNVQGVGTKVALNVLSILSPGELANAVAVGDKAMVARANGVGPKVAARIVIELKDKAPGFASIDPVVAGLAGSIEDRSAPAPVADAVSALVNLGYAQLQASVAVAAALREAGDGADAARLIRLGLRELAK
ncbi:Holliday junction branch migration protein RuvA [Ancylobacter amanitiformis]|uniref:Holliday junction branch migration complex subunit RuvA n=1 Tax=Ancylobacter amanitiformis TaxID=217069 RepID=A0ABU0LNP1_9HYPH|nr:Holliday junction branch migration protein RuvA [Ancylobacter amanitiformis]MDQ0510322.1 Holliday junction DNA helicase RuvA [Ancylobacter amanitiformis]